MSDETQTVEQHNEEQQQALDAYADSPAAQRAEQRQQQFEDLARDREEVADELYGDGPERRAEAEAMRQEGQREGREELARRQIARLSSFDDADKGDLAKVQQARQVYNTVAANLVEAQRKMAADPALDTEGNRRLLAERAQLVAAWRAELQDADRRIAANVQQRIAHAERLSFQREFPELADQKFRDELVAWAKEKGIPESVARGTTDKVAVGRALREFQREKRAEAEAQREAKRVASLPLHTQIAESKGRPDPTITLYGSPAERAAHRKAFQRGMS